VLRGEVCAVGPEEHVRAQHEQVGRGRAQREEQAHPGELSSAPRDARHVLRVDQAPLRPHTVEVEDDREVLEGMSHVQTLEGHVQVRQSRRYEEED